MKYKTEYNPDVLNCIANLSNDEVFTPPSVANQMLDTLPQELFSNPDVKFLDPFCKSGVFLREIVKRLDEGLEPIITDKQQRIDHILKNQVYGIALTTLTALLSRRSLYCSKEANSRQSVTAFTNPNGNIYYKPMRHTWVNGKCKYCGASQDVYDRGTDAESYAYNFIHITDIKQIFNMQFDVIIGNPPYQLNDGGNGASAGALYDKFVEQSIKLQPRYLCMIIPARWYAGGKGLDAFRDGMLKDNHIRSLHDFNDASECFPGVEIKGGVCYFLWDRDNRGNCVVSTHSNNEIVSVMERPLLEKGCDVFIRHNGAIPILKKVLNKKERSFSELVSSRKPFGLPTNFTDFKRESFPGSIQIYANQKRGYIHRNQVVQNFKWIDCYKLLIPEAIGVGDMTKDWLKPVFVGKNVCCTETYLLVGPFSSNKEAENVFSYTQTRFFHFLLGLKKITQHTTQKVYEFIPIQDFSHPWTDEMLYKKYNLSEDEIKFIESMIRPME